MELIHQKLIQYLPYDILLKLHRRCCFLRGRHWGDRRYSKYIFDYPYNYLFVYHDMVLTCIERFDGRDDFKDTEMYNWSIHNYRGYGIFDDPNTEMMKDSWKFLMDKFPLLDFEGESKKFILYKEHDNSKLKKDLLTIKKHNIILKGTTVEEELIKCDLNGY